jgi:hypothetical protein
MLNLAAAMPLDHASVPLTGTRDERGGPAAIGRQRRKGGKAEERAMLDVTHADQFNEPRS